MEPEPINLQDKRIERTLLNISAMIVDAAEMAQQARVLSVNSEAKLMLAQQALENLYLQLEETENR